MKFDVYCDEAHPDLFSSKHPKVRYLVIGSVWFKKSDREVFKTAIHDLRNQYKIGGEFKWTKLSPSKLDFYKALLTWFIEQEESLRFRCIAIDHKEVDLIHFHQSDQELGFYKFYYQMLHHWIDPFNEYDVFCDYKSNRLRNRLKTLKDCLNYSNLASQIKKVQSVRSGESVLIQLADVLTGLASARLNKRLTLGSAKEHSVLHLEKLLGRRIASTALAEKKFNVFKINLNGGW